MHFYRRDDVNAWLRLAARQSYRLVPSTASGRIRLDSVLAILNRSRVGIEKPLVDLPGDLLTPDESAARFGVTLAELRRWTHRTLRVVPHFRLNKNTIRFSEALFEKWVIENSAA